MQDIKVSVGQSDQDTRTLSELNAHYIRSVEECDAEWFKTHLASDFMNTNPDVRTPEQ